MEVVLGLLYEDTDFHPRSAMVWNTIANARKCPQQAKQLCTMREDRINTASQKGRVKPTRRLNQKTSEAEVRRKGIEKKEEDEKVHRCNGTKKTGQNDLAKAEINRPNRKDEQDLRCNDSTGAGQNDFAKAETNRPHPSEGKKSDTRVDETDHFEPCYHPNAASSDGRQRTWKTFGKSAI